jgi:peptidyl-tRNA hydrolase
MKMYILVKQSLTTGEATVAACHAAVAAVLEWQNHPDVKEWLANSFKKVVCVATDSEFEAAKEHKDRVIMTESRLNNAETAIGFKPRKTWPESFRSFKLYR